MDVAEENWPWGETHVFDHEQLPIVDSMLSSSLLDDFTLSRSSKSCPVDNTPFDWDADLFSQLDDFILFPDTESEELRLCEEFRSPQQKDEDRELQLSPVSSITESISSPATSPANSQNQNNPENRYNASANTDKAVNRRRRRSSATFPCTMCKRVCFTSVEARRHHARHIKPFKCTEATLFPAHSQTLPQTRSLASTSTAPSTSAARRGCEKSFATKNELERHRKSVHYCVPEVGPIEWYKCPIDGCKVAERLWPRRDNLLVHMKQSHPESFGVELRVFIPEKDGLLMH